VKVIKSEKFNKWYKKLDMTKKTQVDVRLTRILLDSNLGIFKKIGNIFELKFISGLRVYYSFDGEELVLLLNGGGKNTKLDQNKDIEKAKQIYKEYLDGK
jgi:putative addiction module killer protein